LDNDDDDGRGLVVAKLAMAPCKPANVNTEEEESVVVEEVGVVIRTIGTAAVGSTVVEEVVEEEVVKNAENYSRVI